MLLSWDEEVHICRVGEMAVGIFLATYLPDGEIASFEPHSIFYDFAELIVTTPTALQSFVNSHCRAVVFCDGLLLAVALYMPIQSKRCGLYSCRQRPFAFIHGIIGQALVGWVVLAQRQKGVLVVVASLCITRATQ